MKICMMTNTYLPHVGGVARSVSTFAEEFRRRRHEVLVVAPSFEGKPLAKRREAIVERVAAIQNFNGSDFSICLPLAAGLSDRIDNFKPDIIHAHHPFLLGDTALRLSASKNVPIIFTHHTRYEDYTHYVPFDSPALRDVAINLSTQFANLCDGVIAPSESLAELIRSRGVLSPVRVVPTGVNVAAFARGDRQRYRKRLRVGDDDFIVGHVGRLAPEKNLGYLAEAVANFLKAAPSARFLVIGGGPSAELLMAICDKHGVRSQLEVVGQYLGATLADAYAAMDVFAFASLSETQGIVLIEAMAAGVPVAALDAPGVRDVLRHDRNGVLLPDRAPPEALAAELARLHANPARRQAMAAEARQTAAELSVGRCADRALEFYEEIRLTTQRERLEIERTPWGPLLKRIGVEWNLLAEKAQSVSQALALQAQSP